MNNWSLPLWKIFGFWCELTSDVFLQWSYRIGRVHPVASGTCLLSHTSFFRNHSPSIQLDDKSKFIFEISSISAVNTSSVPLIFLIVLRKKYKSNYSFDHISPPSIIPYLWFPCKSYTWKLHITLFIASHSGSKFFTLLVYLVLKLPTCVLQWNGLVVFFRKIFIFFPSIIVEMDR